jgi:hypothetical protein
MPRRQGLPIANPVLAANRRLVQADERDRVLFATSPCSSVSGSRFRIPATVLASAVVRGAGKARR